MSIGNDVASFLNGTGSNAAKFEAIGDKVKGTIISAEQRQQTDFHTKEPLCWDNGDKRMQLVIEIQTDERTDGDDDGKRSLYIKGSPKVPTTTLGALKAALKAAGVSNIDIGGTIALAYIGGKGISGDPKQWAAKYAPPALGGDFLADPAPAPAAASPLDDFDAM